MSGAKAIITTHFHEIMDLDLVPCGTGPGTATLMQMEVLFEDHDDSEEVVPVCVRGCGVLVHHI